MCSTQLVQDRRRPARVQQENGSGLGPTRWAAGVTAQAHTFRGQIMSRPKHGPENGSSMAQVRLVSTNGYYSYGDTIDTYFIPYVCVFTKFSVENKRWPAFTSKQTNKENSFIEPKHRPLKVVCCLYNVKRYKKISPNININKRESQKPWKWLKCQNADPRLVRSVS